MATYTLLTPVPCVFSCFFTQFPFPSLTNSCLLISPSHSLPLSLNHSCLTRHSSSISLHHTRPHSHPTHSPATLTHFLLCLLPYLLPHSVTLSCFTYFLHIHCPTHSPHSCIILSLPSLPATLTYSLSCLPASFTFLSHTPSLTHSLLYSLPCLTHSLSYSSLPASLTPLPHSPLTSFTLTHSLHHSRLCHSLPDIPFSSWLCLTHFLLPPLPHPFFIQSLPH